MNRRKLCISFSVTADYLLLLNKNVINYKGERFIIATDLFNPLQPGIVFLYPLMFPRGIEKQHRAVMGSNHKKLHIPFIYPTVNSMKWFLKWSRSFHINILWRDFKTSQWSFKNCNNVENYKYTTFVSFIT